MLPSDPPLLTDPFMIKCDVHSKLFSSTRWYNVRFAGMQHPGDPRCRLTGYENIVVLLKLVILALVLADYADPDLRRYNDTIPILSIIA